MHNRDLDALESAVGLLLIIVVAGLGVAALIAVLLVVIAVSIR